MAEKSRVHIIVSGRVQGVCFRDFTHRKAEQSGLVGWVRNLPNNRVEIIAQGEKQKLLGLLDAVKIGPESARVDDCQIEWQDCTGEFKSFEIVYTMQ
jgi:acylphosphatase